MTRDDLPDGGAEHFYRSVLAVRERTGAAVEVLTPDFLGKPGAIERVVEAAPEVFNHNTETVPRLYREVRGRKSDYRWTLELLRRVKQLNPAIKTKSGLMLGLGETHEELFDTLADLRDVGCDLLTLGPVPAAHARAPAGRALRAAGRIRRAGPRRPAMGFSQVASGPFVLELSRPRDGRRREHQSPPLADMRQSRRTLDSQRHELRMPDLGSDNEPTGPRWMVELGDEITVGDRMLDEVVAGTVASTCPPPAAC